MNTAAQPALDVFGLPPITLNILCRTSPESGAPGVRHPVTFESDGTLTTVHDLAAERMAVALGGYLTCVELADKVAPVFRTWALLQQRAVPLPIVSRNEGRNWRPRSSGPCCPKIGVKDPVEAADHARSVRHLAAVSGVDGRILRRLVDGAELPQVRQWPGVRWMLWRCGVDPATVTAVEEDLGLQEPMDPEFYLGVLCRRPDRRWLRRIMEEAQVSQQCATWLAWSYGKSDRRDPGRRIEWLRMGIPVRAIVALERTYSPADVHRVSEAWRVTPGTAALHMLAWLEQELEPSVEQWCRPELLELGYPPRPPGLLNIHQVRTAVDPYGCDLLTAALALVEHGSVAAAAAALRG